MNFLRLRADSHAQYEIRVYAEDNAGYCKMYFIKLETEIDYQIRF